MFWCCPDVRNIQPDRNFILSVTGHVMGWCSQLLPGDLRVGLCNRASGKGRDMPVIRYQSLYQVLTDQACCTKYADVTFIHA